MLKNFRFLKKKVGFLVQKISNLLRFENGFDSESASLCEVKSADVDFSILKIVSFTERGSLTENNGTITNVERLMVMDNFFKVMGGHDEKLKNFGKSIIDLYELDKSNEKNFF